MQRSLWKLVAGFGLLLVVFPPNATALTVYRTRCSCSVPWSTFPQKVQHFQAVFVGYVADVHYQDPPAEWSYTFVVDRSWKGPSADTVNVGFRNQSCEPSYLPGAKYLVLASAVGNRLMVPLCEDPIRIQDAKNEQAYLGPPKWIAAPNGDRQLDSLTARTLAPYPNVQMRITSGLSKPIPNVRVDLRLTGRATFSDINGIAWFKHVAPGWYRIRLTYGEGNYEERYVPITCGRGSFPDRLGHCSMIYLNFISAPGF